MSIAERRAALIRTLGADIARFQEASYAFDDAAARAVGLDRSELRAIGLLLFGGGMPLGALRAALELSPRAFAALVDRIELTGYARRAPSPTGEMVELTEHARQWVETIWGPMQLEGANLLAQHTTAELELMARLTRAMCAIQETHAERVRGLSEVPSTAPKRRARGGLSPAALRRVQLFVEANLAGAVGLGELAAAAGLSEFHFARAFKTTMGLPPRAFVEERRVEKAKALLRHSRLSLAEVAVAVGLGSQSRFTTTFRRATGLTPASYRRGG
ncbi:MAG: helix-turn-helix domain-containing protein [Myxococcales bacterium]|nr:helix-turn-helix domain-containing protein [Myxococcales bacterium]